MIATNNEYLPCPFPFLSNQLLNKVLSTHLTKVQSLTSVDYAMQRHVCLKRDKQDMYKFSTEALTYHDFYNPICTTC